MTRPRAKAPAARPRAATAMMPSAEIIAAARKHIATTKRQVTQIKADAEANRSTRDQRAMRKKAEAFDRLGEILAGK